MRHIRKCHWLPVFTVLITTVVAIIACGGGDVQPENTRITTPLEADCGVPTSSFAFGESAFTSETATLDMRFKLDIIRTQFAAQESTLLVVYSLEIENQGDVLFALIPSLQVFISGIGGQSGVWGVSGAAMNEAGLTLDTSILDVTEVAGDEILTLEMAAYTPIGAIDQITLVLDPLAEAAPNAAHWHTVNPNNCLEGQ